MSGIKCKNCEKLQKKLELIKVICKELNGELITGEELTKKNKIKVKINDDGKITNDPDGAVVFSSKDRYIETVRAVIEAVEQFKIENPQYKLSDFGVLKFHKKPQNNKVIYFHIENNGIRLKYWNAAYEQNGKYIAKCTLEIAKITFGNICKDINSLDFSEIVKGIKEAIKDVIGK